MNDRNDPKLSQEARDALHQELLELAFDCHPDPDALRARIESEPEVAALFDRVWHEAQLLREAADAPLERQARTARPRRDRRWLGTARSRLTTAASMAALYCLGMLGIHVRDAITRDTLAEDLRSVSIVACATAPDDAPVAFDVLVRDAADRPASAAIRWRAFAADRVAAGGDVDVDGERRLRIPADVGAITAIEAETVATAGTSADRAATARLDVRTGAATPLVHVTTDRPLYRPGDVVRVRALCLDRLALTPTTDVRGVRIRVLDALDGVVGDQWCSPLERESGVHAVAFALSDDAPGGRYRVLVANEDAGVPEESLGFVVRRFDPPRLERTVTLDRASYAAGERGVADIAVRRIGSDTPAAAAAIDARIVIGGDVVFERALRLDANGRARVPFEVPFDTAGGPARFVARVDDGGTVETAVEPFTIPFRELEVRAYPEGGALVAGFENRLYVEVTDPRGRPVDGTGRVVTASGDEVARFTTEHEGRARVAFTPRADTGYRVELTAPVAASAAPVGALPGGVALRARAERFAAGAPLDLTVAQDVDRELLVAVYCRGHRVGETTVRGAGARDVSLELDERASGVLRVTVFDAADRTPLAERLVQRVPTDDVRIDVSPFAAQAAPGAPQRVEVRALAGDGTPLEGLLLGASITDGAVDAAAGESVPTLTDRVSLLADVATLEDRAPFLGLEQEAGRNVDLLLGTRGWRRFVWAADVTAVAARDADERTVAWHDGFREPTAGRSATNDADRRLERARHQAGHSWSRLGDATLIAAVFLLFVGVWEFLANRFGRRFETPPLTNAVAGFVGATCCLAVAWFALVLVLAPDIHMFAPRAGFLRADGAAAELDFDAGAAILDADYLLLDDAEPLLAREAMPVIAGSGEAADEALDEEPVIADTELELEAAETPAPPEEAAEPSGRVAASLRPTTVREFAHRARSRDDVRDEFPLTLYWNPLAVTGPDGVARFAFDCGEQVTTWRVAVDAHGLPGRVASAAGTFRTVQPLAISAALPVEVAAGDRLRIPVRVESSSEAPIELRANVDGGLSVAGTPIASVTPTAIPGGAGFAVEHEVTIEVASDARAGALALVASTADHRDVTRHTLRVVPRGFPHRRDWSGAFEDDRRVAAFDVAIPDDLSAAPSLAIRILPSAIAELTQGLEDLLAEPHGCFEQASSVNYPNVLALTWLERTGIVAPDLASRARGFLDRGYAKLTGYECDTRGYEWFGADPGHEALTAYGLLQFTDMQEVWPVDDDMLARTRTWLLARRDGSGRYRLDAQALDRFGRANPDVTAAWCTYALLYAGATPADLATELDAATARVASSDDAYEIACHAQALALGARPDAAAAARARLLELRRDDGSLQGSTTSITASRNNDLAVETTAMAILAWLRAPADEAASHAAADRAVGWLLQQRQGGTFGATQATIQALRALLAHAAGRPTTAFDGRVVVSVDGTPVAERPISTDALDAVTVDAGDALRPGAPQRITIAIEATDGASIATMPWSALLTYHAEVPADDPDCPLALDVRMPGRALRGDTVPVRVRVVNTTDDGLPMTLATIGLPAGLEVPTTVLDDLERAGTIAAWETNGRDVVCYWRDLAPQEAREFVLDAVARIPGTTTGPASRVRLYYSPSEVRWVDPLTIDVTTGR